tara:strand:- start:1309 stop:2265 length:957 start_codon:yes stop_codon:yes gene_type:complete
MDDEYESSGLTDREGNTIKPGYQNITDDLIFGLSPLEAELRQSQFKAVNDIDKVLLNEFSELLTEEDLEASSVAPQMTEDEVLNNPVQQQRMNELYSMNDDGIVMVDSHMNSLFKEYEEEELSNNRTPLNIDQWYEQTTSENMNYQTGEMSGGAFSGTRGIYSTFEEKSASGSPEITEKNVVMFSQDEEGNIDKFKESEKNIYNQGLRNQDALETYEETSTDIEGSRRKIDGRIIDSDRRVWYDPNSGKYMQNWEVMGIGGKDREISENKYNRIRHRMEKRHSKNFKSVEDLFAQKVDGQLGYEDTPMMKLFGDQDVE